MVKNKTETNSNTEFKYIVRIANTDIDGNRSVVYGISQIKGIGNRVAYSLLKQLKMPVFKKIGTLDDTQIDKLKKAIEGDISQHLPKWMVNRKKDPFSGEDIHKIGSDLMLQIQDDINLMKKIRSYRGIRHERGLPVRGQRTKSNGRKGTAIGISRRRGGRK